MIRLELEKIESPGGLSPRELSAFRLGALRAVLACAGEFYIELPSIQRQALANEANWREHELERPETLL